MEIDLKSLCQFLKDNSTVVTISGAGLISLSWGLMYFGRRRSRDIEAVTGVPFTDISALPDLVTAAKAERNKSLIAKVRGRLICPGPSVQAPLSKRPVAMWATSSLISSAEGASSWWLDDGTGRIRVSKALVNDSIGSRYLHWERRFFWLRLSFERVIPLGVEVMAMGDISMNEGDLNLRVPSSVDTGTLISTEEFSWRRFRVTYFVTLENQDSLLAAMQSKRLLWRTAAASSFGAGFSLMSSVHLAHGGSLLTPLACLGMMGACIGVGYLWLLEELARREEHKFSLVAAGRKFKKVEPPARVEQSSTPVLSDSESEDETSTYFD